MTTYFHGAGGTEYSTYAPSNCFTTNENTCGYVLNSEYAYFVNHGFEVRSNVIEGGYIEGRKNYYEVIESLTEVTGRFEGVPEWTGTGVIVGIQGGESKVLRKVQKLKDGGVPIAGLWIQDWAGKRVDSFGSRVLWNWELDEVFYPNWEKRVEEWEDEGIKTLVYINPCLSTRVDEFKPHGRRNLYLEAEKYGFMIKKSDGTVYVQSSASDEFQFGTVDLTNPEAKEWYIEVVVNCNVMCKCKIANEKYPPIKAYEGEMQCGLGGEGGGVKGWMADFGEVRGIRGAKRRDCEYDIYASTRNEATSIKKF